MDIAAPVVRFLREQGAEDEAAFEDSTQTMMGVPNELVPAIRELLAKHHA